VRSDWVVVAAPALDDGLGFTEGVEDLAIEQCIAQTSIQTFDIAILPGTASLNLSSPGADGDYIPALLLCRADPLSVGFWVCSDWGSNEVKHLA
jgi:hypothetical protein